MVNFKVYPETTGGRGVSLARAAARIESETGVAIAVAVQAVDVRACAQAGARVYAQHFDRVVDPQSTGATSWASLRDAGAQGSLLNHSEKRIPAAQLPWYVAQVRTAEAIAIVCARTSAETKRLAALRPHLVAVEPPELIGGNVSVTTADPAVVERSVRAAAGVDARIPVLCGAGVKNARDVRRAVELGAYGVLVASGVTRAKDPADALADLARAF